MAAKNAAIILVVEDEMVLRMRATDIVEDAGYVPIEAISADAAMEILESRDDISLLFTDIQMPGTMDGLRLAHTVHNRWPHIKIILVSGQIAVTDAMKPIDSKFFSKPLAIQQMIIELQQMIGKGAVKVFPPIVATVAEGLLNEENIELRDQLRQAAMDAKALLLKTALDTEKQQLIIAGNQPIQDALATENDSLRLALAQAGIDANALLVQAGIDAEERSKSDVLQNLIHAELHHRMKNMIATVGAITHQSMRTATSMDHAGAAIEGRLAALARAHDLLTKESWENATLDSTVRSAVEPFGLNSNRFLISGEDFVITSSAVIAFAMTLNELCTNAVKYGALSNPEGQVGIMWSVEQDRLHFTWAEIGGPPVSQPTRKSFGSRLISTLGQQLNGAVELEYNPSGFLYSLSVPISALTSKTKSIALR